MNPLLIKFLTGLIRRTMQSSGLVLTVSDSALTEFVVALLTVIGFGWGFLNDYRDTRKLNTAASMPRTTVAQVEAAIRDGEGASAMSRKTVIPA